MIDTSLGCTLKSLTIVLKPKAHMPDDIKTAIASLQTKADSMVANADSGLAAVFQGLSQGKALLKQSRDIAEKTSKDMAFLDEASSTLQKLDEFLNDQSDSAFDFTAGLTLAHTTATSLQAAQSKSSSEASNNFVQEGISCLETFLDTVIQRYSKAVHSWIGNIVSKFKSASGGASVINAAPTFTIPDKQLLHIVEVIGTENIKNKSRCFTAARAALASISNMLVNESNQDAVSIMKASRNWDVFMSAGGSSMIALKLVDDSFKTLMESIKDICTQQVESMVDSAATKHSTTLAEHFAQASMVFANCKLLYDGYFMFHKVH